MKKTIKEMIVRLTFRVPTHNYGTFAPLTGIKSSKVLSSLLQYVRRGNLINQRVNNKLQCPEFRSKVTDFILNRETLFKEQGIVF